MKTDKKNPLNFDRVMALGMSMLLSYGLPGLGYLLIGKRTKALIIFTAIVPCYCMGYFLSGGFFWHEFNFLSVLGFIVNLFNGLPYFITLFGFFNLDHSSRYFEIGKTFMLVSGSLNMLTLVYLFDENPVVGGKK